MYAWSSKWLTYLEPYLMNYAWPSTWCKTMILKITHLENQRGDRWHKKLFDAYITTHVFIPRLGHTMVPIWFLFINCSARHWTGVLIKKIWLIISNEYVTSTDKPLIRYHLYLESYGKYNTARNGIACDMKSILFSNTTYTYRTNESTD